MSGKLTIDCATADAEVLYSIDGSDPTLSYSDTVDLEAGEYTIKAKARKEGYLDSVEVTENATVDYSAGDTVWLDGIECLVVAVDVEIQDSEYTRIAIDKNYDLGYYIDYTGQTQDGYEITERHIWRWGGRGTFFGTSTEVGYGLQNTNTCLSNDAAFTGGNLAENTQFPLMWQGVKDFRDQYNDNWFIPSMYELIDYICPNSDSLTYNGAYGAASSSNRWWSSSEDSSSRIISYNVYLNNSNIYSNGKHSTYAVRLCRVF